MVTTSRQTLCLPDRRSWREWLREHHADTKEIWLVYYKKHTGKPSITYDDAVEEAICFGWIDGLVNRLDDERYMQRYTPRTAKTKWSELNISRARKMIRRKLMTKVGLAAFKNGTRIPDVAPKLTASGTIEIPPDLETALAKNKKASAYVATLPPGYFRMCVTWIMFAKKPETRARRIAEFVSLCAQGKRLGMK